MFLPKEEFYINKRYQVCRFIQYFSVIEDKNLDFPLPSILLTFIVYRTFTEIVENPLLVLNEGVPKEL